MKTRKEIDALSRKLDGLLPVDLSNVAFLCIGTDRSTGDSLGPLVGRYLKRRGIPRVFGTLQDPCHAQNLQEHLDSLQGKFVLAIDSCLGRSTSVGRIDIGEGPLQPGAGVGKELSEAGDAHIKGIVNVGGFMEYFVLQNTRLALVDDMATAIGRAICGVFRRQSQSAMAEAAVGLEGR
ncbi:spore protease YyaC [Paenibacillus donghaensis]|uniref:spore protease YyaC n=1 Tax=Paenibacillus donghaensis TaxID=414771 RepID=UPI002685D19C